MAILFYAPKARPQCPHKAGKRAPPCSPSLGASDHLSALQKDSPAPRSKTVAPLRHNVRLFGGQAPSSAPFVQPPASSLCSSACLRCRLPAFGGSAASAMNPFLPSVCSTAFGFRSLFSDKDRGKRTAALAPVYVLPARNFWLYLWSCGAESCPSRRGAG